MKTLGTIFKLFTALATVVGAIFLLATYGEKIVAFCRDTVDFCKGFVPCSGKCCNSGEVEVDPVEEPAEPAGATEADFEN